MTRPSRSLGQMRGHLPTSILWYLVAYLIVVIVLLWLGQHFGGPGSPDLGWTD